MSLEILVITFFQPTSIILPLLTFGGTSILLVVCLVLILSVKKNYTNDDKNRESDIHASKESICTKCGQKMKVQDMYCQNCGFRLPERS